LKTGLSLFSCAARGGGRRKESRIPAASAVTPERRSSAEKFRPEGSREERDGVIRT
jgi:hypothetical protein